MARSEGASNTACGAALAGAHLAVFTSQKEQDDVLTTLAPTGTDYWFGITCAAKNNTCNSQAAGVWKWQTGGNPAYQDWSNGEPNNGTGCARLSKNGNVFNWADRTCDQPYFAVCSY
jgi:hypothetical protein